MKIKRSPYQFKSKKIEDLVNQKISSLINSMKTEDDYKIEKMVDSFAQTLFYMEESLLYKNNVHMFQLDERMLKGEKINSEEYLKTLAEIDSILKSEVERSYRNFLTFLN